MKRMELYRAAAVAGVACLVWAAGAWGQERVQFEKPPAWSISGTWDHAGERLVIVDASRSRIEVFRMDGSVERSIAELDGLEGEFHPSAIAKYGDGYLLENKDGHMVRLNKDLRMESREDQANLLGVANASGTLTSLFGWAAKDGHIIGFSDIHRNEARALEPWVSAVVEIPLDDPSQFKIVREVPYRSLLRKVMLLGMQVFTIGEDTAGRQIGKVLLMEESGPSVLHVPLGSSLLKEAVAVHALPKKVGASRPAVTAEGDLGVGEMIRAFDSIRSRSLPMGIFSVDEESYLLSHEAATGPNAGTWTLHRIDLATGDVESSISLDLDARNVLVIPGDEYWAFVEKGTIRMLGSQEIPSFVLIPHARIAS